MKITPEELMTIEVKTGSNDKRMTELAKDAAKIAFTRKRMKTKRGK